MSDLRKVIVAGAGVLGLTLALRLAQAGCEVVVHDPAAPGDNASGVAAGMLAPAFEAVLDETSTHAFDLLLAARDLWPGLADELGLALDRRGAVAVGEGPRLDLLAASLSALGLSPERLSGKALQALAPGLSQTIEGGVFTEADWRIDARAALAALRSAAEARGVGFVSRRAPSPGPEALTVLATGAAADGHDEVPELARLTPIKGHILRLSGAAYDGVVVRGEGVYAAPAGEGMILGASMEAGRSDRAVDMAQVGRLLAAGTRLFPGLHEARYAAETGVRAATPDGLPMAGWSSRAGVLLAVGARRNGWLLAPLVAEVIVGCVTGRAPGRHAQRLDPARFA